MIAEFFQNPDSFNILGLLALISAGVLLVLGLTGRVVIYDDGADLALNFGIVLIPLAALFYVAAGCALGTAWISIRENGPLLGAPVAALKISTAILALFLIVFWFVSQDKKQKRSIITNLLFLSVLGWFMSLLVNGDRVRARR